jgi:hypothetical protein
MQRQPGARQQQRAGQRENRDQSGRSLMRAMGRCNPPARSGKYHRTKPAPPFDDQRITGFQRIKNLEQAGSWPRRRSSRGRGGTGPAIRQSPRPPCPAGVKGLCQIEARLMVGGIGSQGGAQVVHRACRSAPGAPDPSWRARRPVRGLWRWRGGIGQQRLGLIQIAPARSGRAPARPKARAFSGLRPAQRQRPARHRGGALFQHDIGFVQCCAQLAVIARHCGQLGHKFFQHRRRLRALKPIDRLALKNA